MIIRHNVYEQAGNPPAGPDPAAIAAMATAQTGDPPPEPAGGGAATPPAGTPPAGTPPAGDPPAGTPPAGDPPAGTPPAGGGDPAPPAWKPNPMWSVLNEKGIKTPEVISSATDTLPEGVNENDLMIQAIQQNALQSLHPELLELNAHLQNNGSPTEFYNRKAGEVGYLNLNSESFAQEYLRRSFGKSDENPDGLTDEAIAEQVENLKSSGTLDLMVLDWKKSEKARIEASKPKVKPPVTPQEQIKQLQTGVKASVDALYTGPLTEVQEIGGVPVTQEQLAAFRPTFEKLVTPDPALGTSPLAIIQNDNVLLFKMLHSLFGTPELIKGMLTNAREDVKKNVLTKLGLETIGTQTPSQTTSKDITIKNLASPSRE